MSPSPTPPMSSIPTYAVSPVIPSTPSAVETGATAGSTARTPRPSSTAASRQPRSCCTHAPSGQRSLREAMTCPTAPPRIGSPERERRHVRLGVVHPAAHVRVDRDIGVANEDLAVAGIRELDLRELEIRSGRRPARASGEPDLPRRRRHETILRPSSVLTKSSQKRATLPRGLCRSGADRACDRSARAGPRSSAPKGVACVVFEFSSLLRPRASRSSPSASNAPAGDFAEGPCLAATRPSSAPPRPSASPTPSTFTLKEPGDCVPELHGELRRPSSRALPRVRRGCRARHADAGRELHASTSPCRTRCGTGGKDADLLRPAVHDQRQWRHAAQAEARRSRRRACRTRTSTRRTPRPPCRRRVTR